MVSEKLDHLKLVPQETLFARPVPRGSSKNASSIQAFKSMLTPLLSAKEYYLGQKELIYYVLELHEFYHSANAIKTLQYIGAELKQVFNPFKILVCSKKEDISNLEKRINIYKYARETIKAVYLIDNQEKIGRQLIKIIKDKSGAASEEITLILNENSSSEEYEQVKTDINSIDTQIAILQEYPEIFMITVRTKLQNIDQIKEMPQIDGIFPKPVVAEFEKYPDSQDSIIRDHNNLTIINNNEPKVPICILDTGVNNKIINNGSIDDDENGHGTKVASLACFSEQLLSNKDVLNNETKIISYKITNSTQSDLIKSIIEAVNTYKTQCRLYCLSHNFTEIDPFFRKIISERLDRFIQKQNILLLNSAGNIDWNDVLVNKTKYPEYISKFEVLSPSECRNVLSVGTVFVDKDKIMPACNMRYGIGEIFIDKNRDVFIYQKPEICFCGGQIDINTVKNTPQGISYELENGKALPVINTSGDVVLESGTSFSVPLIANALSRIIKKYGNEYKNIETYKAILINKCGYTLLKETNARESKPLFHLKTLSNIEYCTDAIYLQFEGEWHPSEQFEIRNKKPFVKGYEVKFFVPKEIKKMRTVICHSNNYELQKIDSPAISFVIKVLKPSQKGINSNFNTLAKPTHLHYAEYKLKEKDCDDLWTIQFKLWGYEIPKEILEKVVVRFGISIKLIPEKIEDIERIYELVKNEGRLLVKVIEPSIISSSFKESVKSKETIGV